MLTEAIDPSGGRSTARAAEHASARQAPAHGVADWPFGQGNQPERPDALPDGRPWPRIHVVIATGVHTCDRACEASLASVTGQGYAQASYSIVGCDEHANAAVRAAIAEARCAYALVLQADDLLAPGALTALCTEAVLSHADAVAGLRVLFDDSGVEALDVRSLDAAGIESNESGDVLFARAALERLFPSRPEVDHRPIDIWARLAAAGGKLARVGRPVLLRRSGTPRRAAQEGLRIASLTDTGYRGGAGIAHRRLGEALALCGHTLNHFQLADESSTAAAEWTDRFPATAEAITGRHDLVLAGNLHASTRSTAILDDLAREVPVASVLHDLFALTGRCAHPKTCPVIATGCDVRCPSPDEYPQLASNRIAGAYASKRALLASAHAPLLLANSAWTRERASALAPAGARVADIALAFPTNVFVPGDKQALRRRLGLPAGDILVLFSAVIADAPDKGFDDLAATLRAVARPGVGFVAIGRLDDPTAIGVDALHAPGPIGDEATLAQWYGACDMCVTASRLETLGQTPIEAGLCGVPTVAYRATGLPSAILDGVTGVLVEPRAGALAQALKALIADGARRERLGAFARIVLENRFSHAASAMSLHDAFAAWEALPRRIEEDRVRFTPDMLGRFAFAAHRHPGASDTVAPPAGAAVRALRRIKHAVIGRGMPLWMRRAHYALARLSSRRTHRQGAR